MGELSGALRPFLGTAGAKILFGMGMLGTALVLVSADLVSLAIGVEVMNALLLPVVLGFLLVLEATALPRGQRMHEDSIWRNRDKFITGRAQIIEFLRRKWARELDYALRKDLWAVHGNRIAVRFQYESPR